MDEIQKDCSHNLSKNDECQNQLHSKANCIENSNQNDHCNFEKENEIDKNKKINSMEISVTTMKNVLKLLYDLIIKNAQNLIIDPQTDILINHSIGMSDIITIFNSLYEYSKNSAKYENNSGFSINVINMIYKSIEQNFGFKGSDLIICAIDTLKKQEMELFDLIDSFIKEDFANNVMQYKETHFVFKKVIGVKEDSPVFIYQNEDQTKLIKFFKRPKRFDISCPRNIIVLSKYHIEGENFDHGVLLHNDYHFENDYGVNSCYVISTSFNHFFFNYLFTAYWSGRSIDDDFIKIGNTLSNDDDLSSIFHITQFEILCFINFCAVNKTIDQLVTNALKTIFVLLPSFPNSVIIKNENPLCAIDFIGEGILNSYKTKIYMIDEIDQETPIPYPLNKETLEFAYKYVHKIENYNPSIWFSITGENFYYKELNGREVDAKFTNPEINTNIKSVFDPEHPSHLVLLIDPKYPHRPENVEPLSWLPNVDKKTFVKSSYQQFNELRDICENQNIINISSQIINGFGIIEKSSDLFFITFSDSFPIVLSGDIPNYIQDRIGYKPTEGKSIKRGIHHLIKHFSKKFVKNQILTDEIPLKIISSTCFNPKYPKYEVSSNNILNEVIITVRDHFQIQEENIHANFIGNSIILLQIKGLSESLINHPVVNDVWNDEYQPCIADNEIKSILNKNQKINYKITEVTHEQSIRVKVFHKTELRISKDEFIKQVNKVTNMFGFFKLSNINYVENIENNISTENEIVGYSDIQLIGTLVGIAFGSTIKDMFSNIINSKLKTSSNQSDIKLFKQKVNSCKKADLIRQIFATNYNDYFDNKKTNILIFQSSNDPFEYEMLEKEDSAKNCMCIDICDDPKTYLPQWLYVYYHFPKMTKCKICKECCIEIFKNMSNLQNAIDPQTFMIDRKKIPNIVDFLPSFFCVNVDCEIFDQDYCRIPFVQGIWTLMNSDDLISHYVKMWFTLNMNVIIRTSPKYFIYCPLHIETIYKTPKKENDLICPKCNAIYHLKCHFWHFVNEECLSLKENQRRCPNCLQIIEKTSGCNHITCGCKKHWCFQCDHSPIFDSPLDCYRHMRNEHHEDPLSLNDRVIHIYLNPQNEKEIIKINFEYFIFQNNYSENEIYIVHDYQNGDKLQIISYDIYNLINNYIYSAPLVIENIRDYDFSYIKNEEKSLIDDDFILKLICNAFGYTITRQTSK